MNPLRPLLLATLLASGSGAAEVPSHTILVLDASGSMWGQIEGRPKIAIAREAVDAMLSGWEGGHLGLIAYGHRRKGDCDDIELLMEPDGFQPDALRQQVAALNPRGMTPISAAVGAAAERLRYTEQRASVILVSDGEETCDADPCALGEELERLGVDFTAHVVGFDIQRGSQADAQLRCLAERTGGRYVPARDAGELHQALGQIAEAAPMPSVRAREGEAWITGYGLEAEVAVTLDANAQEAIGNHDFAPGQDADACQALCLADPRCAGWHYEPGGSYFIEHPRCHLASGAFAVRLRHHGEGWVAGIRPGVKLILVEEAAQ